MYIKKLNLLQIIKIYHKSLRHEFPRNERRPLFMIIKGTLSGTYECIGAFRNNTLLGYAFFVKNANDYLWDYLAVLKPYRNKGIGSHFLKKVVHYYKDAHSVIGEVEDPHYADDSLEISTRSRRLDFYMRNGCSDTNVRTNTFGVRFIIIQLAGDKIEPIEVSRLYKMHYRKSLPMHLYKNNIRTKIINT